MSAFNVVRMRVKPGFEQDFIRSHQDRVLFPGMVAVNVIRTGERDFCVVGEWESMDALVAARPQMIELLDSFRDRLEDLGGGLGVTDPVSGEAVITRRA